MQQTQAELIKQSLVPGLASQPVRILFYTIVLVAVTIFVIGISFYREFQAEVFEEVFYVTIFFAAFMVAMSSKLFVSRLQRTESQKEIASPLGIFSIFFFLFFVIGPLLAFQVDPWYLVHPNERPLFPLAVFYASIGFLFFAFGYRVVSSRRSNSGRALFHWSWKLNSLKTSLVTMFCIVFAARLYMAQAGITASKIFHGENLTLPGTEELYVDTLSSLDRFLWVSNIPVGFALSSLALFVYFRSLREHGKAKNWYLLILFLDGAYNLVLSNRLYLFWLLLLYIIYSDIFLGKILIKWRSLIVFAVVWVFLIYPFGTTIKSLSFEYVAMGKSTSDILEMSFFLVPRALQELFQNYWESLLSTSSTTYFSYRFAGADFFSAILYQHLHWNIPLLAGSTISEAIPILVPRFLWPTKPSFGLTGEGIALHHFNLGYFDAICTPIAEVYANFGLLGICGFMFIFGMAVKYIWLRLVVEGIRDSYVYLYATYIIFILNQDQEIVNGLLVNVRNMAVLWVFVRLLDLFLAKRVLSFPARGGTSLALGMIRR
jgi:hypothetical protein